MNVRAKFEVRSLLSLPIPETIGGTQKIWAVPGYAHAPFSPKFQRAFVRMDPMNVSAKFAVRIASPVPEIIAIACLGWGCEPPILGKKRP